MCSTNDNNNARENLFVNFLFVEAFCFINARKLFDEEEFVHEKNILVNLFQAPFWVEVKEADVSKCSFVAVKAVNFLVRDW
jgi:hypothetical protein